MKYSSLSVLASSAILLSISSGPFAHGQTSEDSLLQLIDAQDRRITQLESQLADLRAQIGIASSPPTPSTSSIGSQRPPKPTPPSGNGKTYVIQQGETLHAVARKHNVSVSQLVAANNLTSPDNIQLGQALVIPRPHSFSTSTNTGTAPAAPGSASPSTATIASYSVRQGDTLSSIARAHGASISAIIAENNLTNPNSLALGQPLRIPGATKAVVAGSPSPASPLANSKKQFPSGYAYYTVIPGDNLYSIARVFGTSQQELERINNLAPGASIRPNQQIIVPMANYSGPYRTS
ncbi:MAG: LysM peptidoglycan-binding domain-containing protein [Verrucomicrobiota bacterium]